MTREQKNQLNDRAQFRRYAEAALGGMKIVPGYASGSCNGAISDRAFELALQMMLAESQAFERYQLMASQVAIDEERKRQGIEVPYTEPS